MVFKCPLEKKKHEERSNDICTAKQEAGQMLLTTMGKVFRNKQNLPRHSQENPIGRFKRSNAQTNSLEYRGKPGERLGGTAGSSLLRV